MSDDKVGGSQIQSVQIPDSKSDSPQFAGNFARFWGGIECGFSALVQFSTSTFLYGEVYHFGKPKQISNHFSFGVECPLETFRAKKTAATLLSLHLGSAAAARRSSPRFHHAITAAAAVHTRAAGQCFAAVECVTSSRRLLMVSMLAYVSLSLLPGASSAPVPVRLRSCLHAATTAARGGKSERILLVLCFALRGGHG